MSTFNINTVKRTDRILQGLIEKNPAVLKHCNTSADDRIGIYALVVYWARRPREVTRKLP
jgi:hypothetical protein